LAVQCICALARLLAVFRNTQMGLPDRSVRSIWTGSRFSHLTVATERPAVLEGNLGLERMDSAQRAPATTHRPDDQQDRQRSNERDLDVRMGAWLRSPPPVRPSRQCRLEVSRYLMQWSRASSTAPMAYRSTSQVTKRAVRGGVVDDD
jgi:hypothetical protein